MQQKINFRLARLDDVKALLEIYAPYVKNTNITFEYEVPTVDEFKNRMKMVLEKFPYIVAISKGKIVGYAYVSTFRSRVAYNWGVETSIYISKAFQKNGLGKKLYKLLEEIVQKQNITNLVASITYPNPQSIAFHEQMGYKKIAHFTKCGYKAGTWLDMIFMEKFINEHTVPAREIIYLPKLDKAILDKIFAKYNEEV